MAIIIYEGTFMLRNTLVLFTNMNLTDTALKDEKLGLLNGTRHESPLDLLIAVRVSIRRVIKKITAILTMVGVEEMR